MLASYNAGCNLKSLGLYFSFPPKNTLQQTVALTMLHAGIKTLAGQVVLYGAC